MADAQGGQKSGGTQGSKAGGGSSPPNGPPNPDPVPHWGISGIGVGFLILAALTFYALVATWPVPTLDGQSYADASIFGWSLANLSADARLFLMVIAAGALGSEIHTLTSFSDYVGNRRLSRSWIWWFLLRPPIGVALALLFYLVLRGGLIVPTLPNSANSPNPTQLLNPYGFAALAAMAGLFSKQATDKLREIFETLFTPQRPVKRSDPLTPAAKPSIDSTDPEQLTAVNGPLELTLHGRGFLQDASVTVNGKARTSAWIDSETMKVTLLPEDIAAAGQLKVIVQNTAAAGGSSEPFEVAVA